jgi:hypothetical protein
MTRYSSYGRLDDQVLEDIDLGFVGFNDRLRPDQLLPGYLEKSENARLDRNGEWRLRPGYDLHKAPLGVGDTALTLPFNVFTDKTVTDGNHTRVGSTTTFRVTSAGHGLSVDAIVNISGTSVSTGTAPNGHFRITAVTTDTFDVTVAGLADEPTGTATIASPNLRDSVVNGVYGSCAFIDPNSTENEGYIILAANTKAVAIKTSDPSTSYDLSYGGESVSDPCDVIQAFNKIYIFRKGGSVGKPALELDIAANNISTSPSFSLATSGAFTQQSEVSVTDLDVATKVGTATVSSVSGLTVGQVLTVSHTGSSTGFSVNDTITIRTIDTATNKFTFIVDVVDQVNKTITFVTKISSNLGFIHMPTPEFGTLHQGRLIVPYQYDPEDSNNARKIYDEIIVSDILDSDTYDRIFGSFRFNAGTSDFTVGIVSFSEDSVLIFNKNSIHRVSGTTNPTTASAQVLTKEIGALSRKSIVQVGKNVFFLSDNGVYSLEFLDEYNLRGTQTPLSEPIAKTMDRMFNTASKDHASKAVGLYFNNRYYLAVPFDGNDFNSHLLIYNFLNNNWESVDAPTTTAPFEYTNLIVSDDEVYAVNTDGGIHKVDGKSEDFSTRSKQGEDSTITQIAGSTDFTDISGVLKTRMYTMSDINRKKFRDFHLSVEGGQNIDSDMSIKLQTENVDLELTDPGTLLGNVSSYLNKAIPQEEDINIRGRIGNRRAYGAQLQLENITGSPKVKNLKITATRTFNSLNPTE